MHPIQLLTVTATPHIAVSVTVLPLHCRCLSEGKKYLDCINDDLIVAVVTSNLIISSLSSLTLKLQGKDDLIACMNNKPLFTSGIRSHTQKLYIYI